jgi:Tfp pilus assembly protein PilX
MSNNTKLLCLFLKAQKQDKLSEQGYAMAVVSIITIIMFSLLAASLVFTNLAKSRTNAFVDNQNSFFVAESGLNKRAIEFRSKLETYSGVADISALTGTKTLTDCFAEGASSDTFTGTDYLGCRNYSFKSRDNAATVAGKGGGISINNAKADEAVNEYMAYTVISQNEPQSISIPAAEDYAGLNALEYKYVLLATAKKPVKSEVTAAANAAKSSTNIDLSMTFTNRVISLFQFAIFYNGDLEFNSTSPMQVQGWVHSNANIYVQPAGVSGASNNSLTTFLTKVSAVGKIYNRVDAWAPGIGRTGITRLLLTGTSCPGSDVFPLPSTSNCKDISDYSASNTSPLTTTEIDTFQKKLQAGISKLKTPPAGFTRKRSYATDKIGEYFAKADMRLDFVPNRGTSAAVIPFNFTAMTTTGSGTCSTAAPGAGSDPDANYIDPNREGQSTLKCNQLTKGQLQSLRQPVLVLTKLNQTSTLQFQENTALDRPTLPTPPALNTLNDTLANKSKILRALQVAIVSNPDPISVDLLDKSLNDSALTAVKANFIELLDIMFPVPTIGTPTPAQLANQADKTTLLSKTPNEIAALREAWFLPAPIQRVRTTTGATTDNPTGSGFYDGRELRWISVLQTNIASLAVWNRDGLYVNDATALTLAYTSSLGNRTTAFDNANAFDATHVLSPTTIFNTANGADGLVFDRATTILSSAKGLQKLGLGSIDSTEGGLVVYASVNDDLNGNGSIDTTNEITGDTTQPIQETKVVGGVSTTTTIDYLRKYPGAAAIKKSPFAFAFTGGDYLPNNLLLSSDQAIYVQGNFNNNKNDGNPIPNSTANTPSTTRLSASIVADTITVLSNECINKTTPSALGVPAGQLNCGVPVAANLVGSPMVINAAFLSNTDASIGNYQGVVGETLPAEADRKYSGGVNNYIRLLEDWNNGGTGSPYTLNYMGSMISLGVPLEYSGKYRAGGDIASSPGVIPVLLASYYNIPFRSYSYDPNFNNVDKMPPLTPKASYIQQKNFSRTY